jgi:hypothetical protein
MLLFCLHDFEMIHRVDMMTEDLDVRQGRVFVTEANVAAILLGGRWGPAGAVAVAEG